MGVSQDVEALACDVGHRCPRVGMDRCAVMDPITVCSRSAGRPAPFVNHPGGGFGCQSAAPLANRERYIYMNRDPLLEGGGQKADRGCFGQGGNPFLRNTRRSASIQKSPAQRESP